MKKVFITLFLILISVNLYSQQMESNPSSKTDKLPPGVDKSYIDKVESGIIDPAAPVEVNKLCMEFFNSLILGDIKKAYSELLKGSPIVRNEKKLKMQLDKTKEAIKLYGKILAYESVSSKYLANSYVTLKFITLHNYNPLLWTISFYKSPTIGWIVMNLKLTDYIKIKE